MGSSKLVQVRVVRAMKVMRSGQSASSVLANSTKQYEFAWLAYHVVFTE